MARLRCGPAWRKPSSDSPPTAPSATTTSWATAGSYVLEIAGNNVSIARSTGPCLRAGLVHVFLVLNRVRRGALGRFRLPPGLVGRRRSRGCRRDRPVHRSRSGRWTPATHRPPPRSLAPRRSKAADASRVYGPFFAVIDPFRAGLGLMGAPKLLAGPDPSASPSSIRSAPVPVAWQPPPRPCRFGTRRTDRARPPTAVALYGEFFAVIRLGAAVAEGHRLRRTPAHRGPPGCYRTPTNEDARVAGATIASGGTTDDARSDAVAAHDQVAGLIYGRPDRPWARWSASAPACRSRSSAGYIYRSALGLIRDVRSNRGHRSRRGLRARPPRRHPQPTQIPRRMPLHVSTAKHSGANGPAQVRACPPSRSEDTWSGPAHEALPNPSSPA